MKEIIDVQIGEVRVGQGQVILQSKAIGSCIAIAAYDVKKNTGALAHIMLPGRAPDRKERGEKNKYATNAIGTLLVKMRRLGSINGNIEVVLVGGANVLNKKDDTICNDNINSILELLRKKKLKVSAQALGGTERRSVSIDVGRGTVFCAEGDRSETQLWTAQKTVE